MKEILVLADTSTASQQRTELAMQYGRHLGAHVTGLFVKPEVQVMHYLEESTFLDFQQRYVEQYETEFNARLAEAERQFQKSVAGLIEGADAIIEEGDADEILAGYAHRSDCIILGQHNPNHRGDPTLDEPDDTILQSGRPVIVVPYVKCSTAFPQRIMVAWDGSREATRALSDAMPLLKKARAVELCIVGGAKSKIVKYAGPDDMVVLLQRHGVTAEARHLNAGNLSTGNTLLNRIADSGAEMLVAGAYGHNRIKEMVLGGVTRELLAHCSIPLFMSR